MRAARDYVAVEWRKKVECPGGLGPGTGCVSGGARPGLVK